MHFVDIYKYQLETEGWSMLQDKLPYKPHYSQGSSHSRMLKCTTYVFFLMYTISSPCLLKICTRMNFSTGYLTATA